MMEVSDGLSCSVCNKNFKSKRGLSNHVTSHGPHDFKCDICHKDFSNRDGLQQHLKTHDAKKHLCTHCGKSFSKPYWLRRHEEINHENITSATFECETCGKRCSSKRVLVAHKASHTLNKEHAVQCMFI